MWGHIARNPTLFGPARVLVVRAGMTPSTRTSLFALLVLLAGCDGTASASSPPERAAVAPRTERVEVAREVPSTPPAATTPSAPSTVADTEADSENPALVDPHPFAPAEDGRHLLRFVIARDVQSREPVDVASSFPVGEKLFAFVEIGNDPRTEGTITLGFERDGATSSPTPIELHHNHMPTFRTWAYQTPRRAGRWYAVARTSEGEELGRVAYDVTE